MNGHLLNILSLAAGLLSTGKHLPAYSSTQRASDIHPVTGGCSLSNYPEYQVRLLKVLQKYNRSRPTALQDPAQDGQGPLRFSIFQ